MERTITPEALLAYMNPGQAYTATQVAMQFVVGTAGMRNLMQNLANQGLIEPRRDGKRLSWVKPVEGQGREMPPMRPLTISREMRLAMERCKELRLHPSLYAGRSE